MQVFNIHHVPTSRSSTEELLKYELLEIHEAAFWLTKWPKNLYKWICAEMIKIEEFGRNFVYIPGPTKQSSEPWMFETEELGREFSELFQMLSEAIGRGEIEAIFKTGVIDVYDERSIFFVSPPSLLKWALLKGIIPPEEVQERTVRIFKINKRSLSMNNVEIKIIGQFLLHYYPGERISWYIDHDWMRVRISHSDIVKDNERTVRNALNELRPGVNRRCKSGNRSSQEVKNQDYTPKPIDEVLRLDSEGRPRFHPQLLMIAVSTMVHILHKAETSDRSDLKSFIRYVIDHKVVKLYTSHAPPLVLDLIHEQIEAVAYEKFLCEEIANMDLTDR